MSTKSCAAAPSPKSGLSPWLSHNDRKPRPFDHPAINGDWVSFELSGDVEHVVMCYESAKSTDKGVKL